MDFARCLKILGFELDDDSDKAEIARTWINGTLDNDESWFDGRSDEFIRGAFHQWVEMVCHAD